MKILIVYFSHRGNTARLAEELAWHCGADRERIRLQRGESSILDRCRSLWRRLRSRQVAIAPETKDPASYDLVVIGTPVQKGAPALAVRSYVAKHAAEFKRVAFFCTNCNAGAERAMSQLQKLCGQEPVDKIFFEKTYSSLPTAGERVRGFSTRLVAGA